MRDGEKGTSNYCIVLEAQSGTKKIFEKRWPGTRKWGAAKVT